MHYVALSRLRSISGLHTLNMNENKIAVSKKVQEEMTRLRQKATLNSHIPFHYKDTSESFKILFQNVRSLHLHIADVASDYNVKAADVNIFCVVRMTMHYMRSPIFNYSETTLCNKVQEHLMEQLFT